MKLIHDEMTEKTGAKTCVMIGKAPRYFNTRAQAITALNAYNVRHGLPLYN